MMKTAAILMALVLTLAATDQPQKSPAESRDVGDGTLLANERALHAAMAKADRAAFTSLVLPEGVWGTSEGFIPLNLLENGLDGFHVPKRDIVNPRVTRLDENSAVVLYSLVETGTSPDRSMGQATIASTVWTRRSGKWVVALHQETDLVRK